MTRKNDRWVNVFFFFVVLLAPLSVYRIKEKIDYYHEKPPLWDESLKWPTIAGTITTSRVAEFHLYDSATEYSADVTYEYSVDGQQYVSDNFDFGASGSTTNRSQAQDIVDRYPSGMAVNVHYDPDNTGSAVLIPGCTGCRRSPFILLELIGLVLGTLCLLVYIKDWWSGRKRKKELKPFLDALFK